MRVAVVGGGPSGLVTLKYLLDAHNHFPIEPIEARLFEAEDDIGGTFRYRSYEDAELVSSKQLTTFSDFRIPLSKKDEYKDFLSVEQYLSYLSDYCNHFGLRDHIQLKTRVTRIRRGKPWGHVVSIEQNGVVEEWYCDAVSICSGLHVKPVMPRVPGLETVPEVFHSSKFKTRDQFGNGKNIAILGSGETAMDIAYLAVTSPTKSVVVCHRNGFCWAPKAIPDFIVMGQPETGPPVPPIDVSASSLFDTAYVHPKLKNAPWLWEYYDKWTKLQWILVNGSRYGYGQHIGQVPPDRFHMSKVIFNKSNMVLPYINDQYRRDSALQRFRASIIELPPEHIIPPEGKKIELATFPTHIDENGTMHFKPAARKEYERMKEMNFRPDVVICATGYEHTFPFLDPSYPHSGDADVRAIWYSADPSVAFIGFVRPSLGAIPPLAEFQAQLWITNLLGRLPKPIDMSLDTCQHYRLHTNSDQRVQHGVDHETYAYQLALDMGSAPSFLTDIWPRGWKVSLTWALGANFNTKFRLMGPWQWDGAEEVIKSELWDTVARRRVFWGQITNCIAPLVCFGILSLCCWVIFGVLDLVKAPFVMLSAKHKRPNKAYQNATQRLQGTGKSVSHSRNVSV